MAWDQTCPKPCTRKEHTPETCRTSIVHLHGCWMAGGNPSAPGSMARDCTATSCVRIKTEDWPLLREHDWPALAQKYGKKKTERMMVDITAVTH